jgi:hypothetical protein
MFDLLFILLVFAGAQAPATTTRYAGGVRRWQRKDVEVVKPALSASAGFVVLLLEGNRIGARQCSNNWLRIGLRRVVFWSFRHHALPQAECNKCSEHSSNGQA